MLLLCSCLHIAKVEPESRILDVELNGYIPLDAKALDSTLIASKWPKLVIEQIIPWKSDGIYYRTMCSSSI